MIKKIMNNYEALIMGASVGVFSTAIAIHVNVKLNVFDSYYACTNAYLFCGLLFIGLFMIYYRFIKDKYYIKKR